MSMEEIHSPPLLITSLARSVIPAQRNRRGSVGLDTDRAPESTAEKAFDFNSTVDSRRLSTLVYHSAHSISIFPSTIGCIFPADRMTLAGRQSTPGLDTDIRRP
eukprot:1184185-Prorocentrum_minimum.AAC.2